MPKTRRERLTLGAMFAGLGLTAIATIAPTTTHSSGLM